jgi:hypothetical protein
MSGKFVGHLNGQLLCPVGDDRFPQVLYRAFVNFGLCANTVEVPRHIIYHFRPFIPFAYPYALGYPLKTLWRNENIRVSIRGIDLDIYKQL